MLYIPMSKFYKQKYGFSKTLRTPSFSRSLPLSQSLLLVDSNIKQNWVDMEQLAFFNLQRERLKHGSREPDLHHIVFSADSEGRERNGTWYLLSGFFHLSGGKTGKLDHDTFDAFVVVCFFFPRIH